MATQSDVAATTRELGPLTTSPAWAQQVESLAVALDDAAGAPLSISDDTAAWAELDLHRAFPSSAFDADETSHPSWLGWVDIARVVAIFLPIVITWFGVWLASEAYAALLAEDPDAARQPFIALWQTGFDGHIWGGMTLGRVALLDFTLIIVVIGLTSVASVTRHRHDLDSDNRRLRTRSQIDVTLSRASLTLAQVRLSSPTRFKGELVSAAATLNTLLGRLNAAADRISDSIESSTLLASSLDDTASGLHSAGSSLADSARGLEQSVESARATAETALAAEQANAAANEAVLREVQAAVGSLSSMATEFSSATADLSMIVQGMLQAQRDLKTALSSERKHQTVLAKTTSESAEQLESVTGHLSAVTSVLPELAQAVEDASGTLDTVHHSLQASAGAVVADTGQILARQNEINDLLRRTIATVEVGVEQMRASVLDMNDILGNTLDLLHVRSENLVAEVASSPSPGTSTNTTDGNGTH